METALKIAFATTDMETVNQHFGSAKSFAIYAVDMDDAQLLEAAQFGELQQDGNEDKLSVKIELLNGCAAVYCQAVGGSAINQLIAKNIQPVKVHEGGKIKDLIVDLQNEMKAGPSNWLAKAINQHKSPDPERFNQMEDEGWDE
ncbi:nitrogen fixation protein NifX [Methylobacter sp. Wu8]|uniref:Nitrogen fixation protein NifX n=2 Tax=Methylobacter TaxID=429 RepID=A0A2S6GHC2_9GAMM|nr:nitrogen fixation protein NifX [Methylobacter tundripaludum]MCF7965535.1 nitrogen fixation protein NifX [Methylobacter tundripaludum]MCK9636024.1 nitrogen fixation protein NifX [Methylobacter tundripaludum]PPK64605.1 nitrogen fixation protein NifX [Methylobacter tundripaludum]